MKSEIEALKMIKKGYYAIIPASVRYDVRLTANAKLLYGEITALTNEKGYCWASNDYFASLYEVSKTSISKWVSALRDAGHITLQLQYKEGTKHILHRYIRLVDDPIEEKLHTPITNVNDPIEDKLNTYVTKVKDPIEEMCKDNNTVNNTVNNTMNRGETSSPALEEVDQEVDQEVIEVEPKEKKSKRFVAPTLDELIDYCNSTNAGIDPVGFWNFYESKGWMIGKNKMKSWPHAVGTWKSKERAKQAQKREVKTDSIRGQSLHDQLTDRSWAD